MPLGILLALIASLFGANTLIQFSKKISSAGGYYTFVAQGSGVRTGVFTGWIYLLYQGINAPLLWGIFKRHPERIEKAGLITADTDHEENAR